MSQLSGVLGFVDNEAPLGGETVSTVITGAPDGHRDDVLYMGVRVGTTDECFYVRDVIGRAGASMTVGTGYAVGKCARLLDPMKVPDETRDASQSSNDPYPNLVGRDR